VVFGQCRLWLLRRVLRLAICPAPGHSAVAGKGGVLWHSHMAERAVGDFSLAPAQTDRARTACHDPKIWCPRAGRWPVSGLRGPGRSARRQRRPAANEVRCRPHCVVDDGCSRHRPPKTHSAPAVPRSRAGTSAAARSHRSGPATSHRAPESPAPRSWSQHPRSSAARSRETAPPKPSCGPVRSKEGRENQSNDNAV
jgi:hypothetical protein